MSAEFKADDGMRRVALALHALAAEDRNWLLQQLPAADRQGLDALLRELQELGLPPEPELIDELLAQATATRKPVEGAAGDPVALARVLQHEAPVLQGLFLSALQAIEQEQVRKHWQDELHPPPSAKNTPAWTGALREAVADSWRAVATEAKEKS